METCWAHDPVLLVRIRPSLHNLSTMLNQTSANFYLIATLDPLSQFEVTKRFFGFCLHGFNNFAFLFVSVLTIFFVSLYLFSSRLESTYEYGVYSTYQLVCSIVKENLYIQRQQYFAPLFFLFGIIFLSNLLGLLPFSFTITSSFAFTVFLASTYFVGVNIIGAIQHGWKLLGLFLPDGAPFAIVPFLIFIEAVSYIARVISLAVRLFANMMSGHALLKILIGFSWAMLCSLSVLVFIAPVPWVVVTAVLVLETMIAFLQAYVFVLLVSLYINDVLNLH